MKKLSLFICLCALSLLLSITALCDVNRVTMYAPDGRTIIIAESSVEEYKKVGWFTEPPVTLYAPDGRTVTIEQSAVEEYSKNGWFTEPPVLMYFKDGKTKYVLQSQVETEKANGLFTEKPVTMYSVDGRTITVVQSAIEQYKNVGWFTEPPVQLYAADGRTKYVIASRVPAEEAVGWYSDKSAVTKKMFALDGRTKTVFNARVAAEQSVGWYLLDDYTASLLETGGYEKVCERLDMHYAAENDEIFLTKKSELLDEWFIKERVPMVITHSEIAHDSKGVPVAVISFRNIGKASVESFECTFSCHDIYGNITSDSPEFNGLALASASVSITPGQSYTGFWKLIGNTKTVKTGKIFITKIVLSDGTVYTA